jgi:hypothetical protein
MNSITSPVRHPSDNLSPPFTVFTSSMPFTPRAPLVHRDESSIKWPSQERDIEWTKDDPHEEIEGQGDEVVEEIHHPFFLPGKHRDLNHEHSSGEEDVEQIEGSQVVVVPQADVEVGNGGTPREVRDESAKMGHGVVHRNDGGDHHNATEDVKKQGDGRTVGIILRGGRFSRRGRRGPTSEAEMQMASETPKARKRMKKPVIT